MMDDREKTGKLMDDVSRLCSEAQLPSVMILGVLEAIKFTILDQTMDGAKIRHLEKIMQQPEKIKVE